MWKINAKEYKKMQYLVEIGIGTQRNSRIEYLKKTGYEGDLPQDYPFSVVIIGHGYFRGGNVTCFAASASNGNKVLPWETWKALRKIV